MIKRLRSFLRAIVDEEHKVADAIGSKRESAFERFPLIFTLLGAFGLVATFYGFERLIDQVDFLSRNPFILLGTGLFTLIVTGTLYDKLN